MGEGVSGISVSEESEGSLSTLDSALAAALADAQSLKAEGDSLLTKMAGVVAVLNGGALLAATQAPASASIVLPMGLSALSLVLAGPALFPMATAKLLNHAWLLEWGDHPDTRQFRRLALGLVGDTCERTLRQNKVLGFFQRLSVSCGLGAVGASLGLLCAGGGWGGAFLGFSLALVIAFGAWLMANAAGLSAIGGGVSSMASDDKSSGTQGQEAGGAGTQTPQIPAPVPTTSIKEGGQGAEKRG